jgi:hypothetical protein
MKRKTKSLRAVSETSQDIERIVLFNPHPRYNYTSAELRMILGMTDKEFEAFITPIAPDNYVHGRTSLLFCHQFVMDSAYDLGKSRPKWFCWAWTSKGLRWQLVKPHKTPPFSLEEFLTKKSESHEGQQPTT